MFLVPPVDEVGDGEVGGDEGLEEEDDDDDDDGDDLAPVYFSSVSGDFL